MAEGPTGSQLVAGLFMGCGGTYGFSMPTILSHSLHQVEQRSKITRGVTQRVTPLSRPGGPSALPAGGAAVVGDDQHG